MSSKEVYHIIKEAENTDNEASDHWWYKKRRYTSYICITYGFLLGMDYSGIVISLPFYLRDDLSLTDAKLYYSILTTAMSFSAAVSGIVFGRFIDKSRNLRLYLLVFPCLACVGNVLYTLHYSVWLLLIGRLLCGISDAAQPAISGEFSRIYQADDLTRVLERYQTIYSIGFVIGPATTILFKPINITIGTWQLNQNNFVGMFLAILLALFMIVAYFGVSNLSEFAVMSNQSREIKKSNDEDNESGNQFLTLQDMMCNFDVMLIVLSSALSCTVASMIELLFNIVASSTYQWTLFRLGIVTTACVGFYALVMIPFGRFILVGSKQRVFYLYLMCFILPCVAMVLLMLSKQYASHSVVTETVVIACIVLVNIFSGISAPMLARRLLFQVVPSHSASFAEGVRSMFARVFSLAGFFSAAFVYTAMDICMPIIIVIFILTAFILFSRRNKFYIYDIVLEKVETLSKETTSNLERITTV